MRQEEGVPTWHYQVSTQWCHCLFPAHNTERCLVEPFPWELYLQLWGVLFVNLGATSATIASSVEGPHECVLFVSFARIAEELARRAELVGAAAISAANLCRLQVQGKIATGAARRRPRSSYPFRSTVILYSQQLGCGRFNSGRA